MKVEFEEYELGELTTGWMGSIKELSIFEIGESKQDAFNEVLISLGVLLAYNSGMKYIKIY